MGKTDAGKRRNLSVARVLCGLLSGAYLVSGMSVARGEGGTAVGEGASSTGNYSTAVGHAANAKGDYSTAVGDNSFASNKESTVMKNT